MSALVSLYPLIKNECIKIVKKKRSLVVLLILAAIIPMFTYAQLKVAQNNQKQFGTTDWRAEQRQKIVDYTRSLGRRPRPGGMEAVPAGGSKARTVLFG
ncbi:hypothetical protein LJK87_08020 [Paenibacillus sp. P25]|nr:hypothetical protein LJK87_08020 [Paenibacillus sp. P25]